MNFCSRSSSSPALRRFSQWLIPAVLLLMLSACAWRFGSPAVSLRAQQPQTWQGEVSCPGCSERWLTVTLFPDGLFRLRETYVGAVGAKGAGEERFHDVGRWSATLGNGSRITLRGASLRHLHLQPTGDLTLLDANGQDIMSIRDYHLKRLHKPDLIADPMRLLALYTADDAGAACNLIPGRIETMTHRFTNARDRSGLLITIALHAGVAAIALLAVTTTTLTRPPPPISTRPIPDTPKPVPEEAAPLTRELAIPIEPVVVEEPEG